MGPQMLEQHVALVFAHIWYGSSAHQMYKNVHSVNLHWIFKPSCQLKMSYIQNVKSSVTPRREWTPAAHVRKMPAQEPWSNVSGWITSNSIFEKSCLSCLKGSCLLNCHLLGEAIEHSYIMIDSPRCLQVAVCWVCCLLQARGVVAHAVPMSHRWLDWRKSIEWSMVLCQVAHVFSGKDI